MPLPQIHERVKRSKLVGAADLESASMKICAKLGSLFEDNLGIEESQTMSAQNALKVLTRNNVPEEPRKTFSELNNSSSDPRTAFPSSFYSQNTANKTTSIQSLELIEPETIAEFEDQLLKKLVKRNHINKWQATKLHEGRSTFFLGAPPFQYRVIAQLGKGGYGDVYHGRKEHYVSNTSSRIQHDVAIKVLQKRTEKANSRYMFLREYEIARKFKCPNIVAFKGFSNNTTIDYCVLEYVDGGDASKLLKRYGRLDYRVASYIILEAAKGLAYLHEKGVIHRDIKPGNILLMKSGEVKLTDFGFITAIRNYKGTGSLSPTGQELEDWEERNWVRETNASNGLPKERKNSIQGTRNYIAPEQEKDLSNPNPLWDVYSLGCAFFSLLTGNSPPDAKEFQEKISDVYNRRTEYYPDRIVDKTMLILPELQDVPRGLANLIMRMMAFKPSERIQSAQEVVDELKEWIDANPKTLFDKVEQNRISNKEDVWSEDYLRQSFGIPQDVPLKRVPVEIAPGFQNRSEINSASRISASMAFYEAAFNPEQELQSPLPPPIIMSLRSLQSERVEESDLLKKLGKLEKRLRRLRICVLYPLTVALFLLLAATLLKLFSG